MNIKFIKKLYTVEKLDLKHTFDGTDDKLINFWNAIEKSGHYYLFLKEINNKHSLGFANLGYRRGLYVGGPGPCNQQFEGIHNMLFNMAFENDPKAEVWLAEDIDKHKQVLGAKAIWAGKPMEFIITCSSGGNKLDYFDNRYFNSWNAFAQPEWLMNKLLEAEEYPDLTEALKILDKTN